MVVGERKRREEEKKRLEEIISLRRSDVKALDEEKKSYKKEIEERIASQKGKGSEGFRAPCPTRCRGKDLSGQGVREAFSRRMVLRKPPSC